MCVAPDDVSEISHKAETYVHYTYVKSQQQQQQQLIFKG